ncbi:MAG TPA: hypothetical protein VFP70_12560, partial [Burkholderiales bacterium]|nr:hypothetical protein [Burkholderiales bacterium]
PLRRDVRRAADNGRDNSPDASTTVRRFPAVGFSFGLANEAPELLPQTPFLVLQSFGDHASVQAQYSFFFAGSHSSTQQLPCPTNLPNQWDPEKLGMGLIWFDLGETLHVCNQLLIVMFNPILGKFTQPFRNLPQPDPHRAATTNCDS